MSDAPTAALRITFSVSPSLQEYGGETHQRSFHNVPHSTAHEIADDFAMYSNEDDSASQQELYQYRQVTDEGTGKQIFLPLDFSEIQSLSVVTDNRTREIYAAEA